MSWEKFNEHYFRYEGQKNFYNGTITFLGEEDGEMPNQYALHIGTSDNYWFTIGFIHKTSFDIELAKDIIEKAISENKDYEWWIKNALEWKKCFDCLKP